MRVMMIENHGGPEVFVNRTIPMPEIPAGHVRIKVRATSVNPIDVKLRKAPLPFSKPLPSILHIDVAGVIDAVAPDVTKFKQGDEVYGAAGGIRGTEGGALAEYMVADARLLAHKPKSLSFSKAAALPLVGITAWEALIDRLAVKPGQKVLIHGGVGGVGHVAVQLARAIGARVHTTVLNAASGEIARELGAHEVINSTEETVAEYVARYTDGQGFDAVFDTVGGENLPRSIEAMKIRGVVASIATGGTHDLRTLYVKGGTLHSVLMLIPMLTNSGREHHGDILTKLAVLIDQGAIKPLIDEQSFTLATVAQAHARLESGQAVGKVVIEVP